MLKHVLAAAVGAALAGAVMAQTPCDADLDADGTVGGFDLALLLGEWGPYAPCLPAVPADLDASCAVNGLDLAMLLAAWGTTCSPLTAQLAGNPLSQYPHFEYVRAFSQGAGFHVAVDPTRFPDLVGKTCDLHIVAHKTAAEWAAVPLLIDLTGGAQTVTITGSTIQANSFAVTGSDALNGTQGAAIGVGYDAILDCNRNGLLDAADVIDELQPNDDAGLYVVRDTAAPGPYAFTELTYPVVPWIGTAGFESENTFYPTNIESLGQLPVIILSQGAGFNYQWYDHIGTHVASYGIIFVSHETNDAPGPFTCSTTTLQHTDSFVQQTTTGPTMPILLPLVGHVDSQRIIWMGHSRAGEGVAIALDRVLEGTYVPVGWGAESVQLISAIAPTDFTMAASANPHSTSYHVWTGSADADLNGCANCNLCQSWHAHDRALQFRQATTLHGAGHSDFHNGGGSSVAFGPCLIGRPRTHEIMRGYLLPLLKYYTEDDIAAKDFLWRQWEHFKPIGAPAESACAASGGVDVVVNLMYRDAPALGNFMIDDFQTNTSPGVSSSGGTVTFDVTNLVEDRADDNDAVFTWTSSDPMNGTTLGGTGDDSRAVAFDWAAPSFLEFEMVEAQRDLSDDAYLSFRAAQGTRHPNTIAALEDLTFDVLLRDGDGTTSHINIAAYGGGIEEPYQRINCGAGVGWANEFETIRIRLSDFLTNGSGLDLTNIVAVRFEFAAPGSGSSSVGRIGLDEIEITKD
jgi:hypothetical protein